MSDTKTVFYIFAFIKCKYAFMTKMYFFIMCFLSCGYLWGQFNIKGKIQAYPSRSVVVTKWRGSEPRILMETKTRPDGSFDIRVLNSYTGRLFLELDKGQIIPMFADGSDIVFVTDFNKLEDTQYSKSKVNQDFLKVLAYRKDTYKMKILSYLLQSYKPSESFYAPLKAEMDRLTRSVLDTNSFAPVLKYNLELDDFLEDMRKKLSKGDVALAKKYRQEIGDRFKTDGEFLESSGRFHSLQQFYISLGNVIHDVQNNKHIKEDIDKILSEVGYETERGQLMLTGFLDFLKAYDPTENLNYFMDKVDKLTCEVLPELKNKAKMYKSVQIGKTAPEIHFNELAYGKYAKLSDIPAQYKILMFWSSNCPHCRKELSAINQRYKELKDKKGEFIGVSLDRDESELTPYLKDIQWYNYCDFKGYTSPPIRNYAIVGTPTFFLIDRDNKILLVANGFDEVMQKLN